MYMRLAFAVAAHLRSDILIVDEVLAVGDQEFQRRCLGKMRDVAVDGRTVLLVSHNMAAVASLCARGVVLRNGRVAYAGAVKEAIAAYTQHDAAVVVANLRERHDRTGKGEIRSTSVMIAGPDGKPTRSVGINEPFDVIVSYDARIPLHQVDVSVIIELMDGTRIATLDSGFKNQSFSIAKGTGQLACHVPGLPLRPDISMRCGLWARDGRKRI